MRNKEKKAATQKAWHAAHKEEQMAYQKIYRAANKAETAATMRAWRVAHREEVAATKRAYRTAHKEETLANQRAWQAANPVKIKAFHRVYYAAHTAEVAARVKIWCLSNPDKLVARNARRRARKANAPINDFTAVQWQEMQKAYNHHCVYCCEVFRGKLTQDHVIPLSLGGAHTQSNIVPACRSCNSRKSAGTLSVQPLYLREQTVAV